MTDDQCTKITSDNDVAVLETSEGKHQVRMFDHVRVLIKAEMLEYRRSINLHFRGLLNSS